MLRKKYGVYGLMEFHANIKVGMACLHVEFKGGHDNEAGVTPATYTTHDKVAQHIIENSDLFKGGRVVLLSVEDLGETEEEKRARLQREAEEKKQATQSSKNDETLGAEPTDKPTGEILNEIPAQEVGHSEEGGEEAKVVEVACKDDAKNYLVDNYGLKASNLRSKIAIEEAAASCGVKFIYPEE